MKYDDARLQKILAAEYVLGTLRGRARQRFERLLWTRNSLRTEVHYWEMQLSPLLANVRPVRPRERVWAELERRIAGNTVPLRVLPPPAAAPRSTLWRNWAIAASLAAVALSVQLYRQRGAAPPPPADVASTQQRPAMVAMLQEPKSTATWLVSVSPADGQIRVIASGEFALDAAATSLELWIIGDDGTPRSLGLMPASGRASMPIPADLQMPAKPVLALSLEPSGGSPTGLPTGPVLTTSRLVAL